MLYPYPKYNDEPDVEAHVRAFLTTWQANHVSQWLVEPETEKSKIVEFGLSLDGQAAGWYTQHNLAYFATFEDLQDKFLRLFHPQFTQRKLIERFYATYQEAHETVPQFIIWF